MCNSIKYIVIVIGVVALFAGGVVSAAVWGIEGIDIISREEWGADESITWGSNTSYDRAENEYDAYQAWLEGVGVDRGGKFAARKQREELAASRKAFFETNYPDEIRVDEEIKETEDGRNLRWSRSIRHDKTKIVIHHTAGSATYANEAEAMSGVRDIYKFHTLQRGWGDIGYNFLIDPFGNIYEGRAGGRGVIGAHAESNNVTSIGISLMGNFDIDEPTPEMLDALIRLVTILSLEFDIEAGVTQPYFTPIDAEPFIEVHEHESIVGHSDTKNTACPGRNVYALLPEIIAKVTLYTNYFRDLGDVSFDNIKVQDIETPVYIPDSEGYLEIPLDQGGTLECISVNPNMEVRSCSRATGKIRLHLKRIGYPASGKDYFIIRVGNQFYLVSATIVWQRDLDRILSTKRKIYIDRHGAPNPEKRIDKISDKVSLGSARELMAGDVRVLLYELTAQYDARDVQCLSSCDVQVGDTELEGVYELSIDEDQERDLVLVTIGGESYVGDEVTIKNKGVVQITNYPRAGSAGPWNLFRGNIEIRNESYYHLDQGFIDRFVVINELSLADYMKGVGESSENQHIEKIKTMTLLAKGYMLYYLNGKNKHPNIPEEASYNAVDDPRIFQKYVGAGWENYGKKWLAALEETKDEVIIYQGYLPILPYFHCSAGYTWSALEKFGRKDTPYLKGVIDFVSCSSGLFEGHGVGLSGDGAEKLAQKGASYQNILKYYYDGIEIVRL